LEDEMPANADATLAYSYDQAKRILEGVPEEDVVNEYEQSLAENPVKPASGKKKSTAELLKSASGSAQRTPKSAGKGTPGRKKQQPPPQQQYEESDDEVMKDFEPGQQIIVDTQIGMWPGIVINLII
jgi:hypothetical protein